MAMLVQRTMQRPLGFRRGFGQGVRYFGRKVTKGPAMKKRADGSAHTTDAMADLLEKFKRLTIKCVEHVKTNIKEAETRLSDRLLNFSDRYCSAKEQCIKNPRQAAQRAGRATYRALPKIGKYAGNVGKRFAVGGAIGTGIILARDLYEIRELRNSGHTWNEIQAVFEHEALAARALYRAKNGVPTKKILYYAAREEIIYRGLYQGVVGKQIPAFFLGKTITEWMQPLRVVATAHAFSEVHRNNLRVLSKEAVDNQCKGAYWMGIVLGLIKESRLGLVGACGAHFMNNYVDVSVGTVLLARKAAHVAS